MTRITGCMDGIRDNLPLLRALVMRDIKGRYKSSNIGFLWHFVAPAVTVTLIYIMFTSLRTYLDPDYWILVASGLLPFMFFRTGPTKGSVALLSKASMIKKMAFPRELIVVAQVVDSLISMVISYVVLVAFVLLTGHDVPISCLLYSLPVIYLSVLFVAGTMLIVSVLNAYFRDFQFIINTTSRVMFWVTPVMFTAESTTGVLSVLVAVNPVSYYIECYHDLLYYCQLPDPVTVLLCVAFSAAVMVAGILVFGRLKGRLAEVL